jgi:hypothetical protein
MKWTSHYSGTNAQKTDAAEGDCKFYLGTAGFYKAGKTLADTFQQGPAGFRESYKTAKVLLAFVGIRGRWPVRAMVRQACKVLRDRA